MGEGSRNCRERVLRQEITFSYKFLRGRPWRTLEHQGRPTSIPIDRYVGMVSVSSRGGGVSGYGCGDIKKPPYPAGKPGPGATFLSKTT